jgi:hypothetical protein
MRYQNGHDMVEDLLALTRPGSTPTLRQAELATAPGLRVPAAAPTINSAPTMQGTSLTAGRAPATVASPAPPTVVAPPPPRVSPPPPAAAAPTRIAAPPRPAPKGSNAGLLIGIAAVAFVLLVGVAGAGWYVWSHRGQAKDAVNPTGPPGTSVGSTTATTVPTSMAVQPDTTVPAPPPSAPTAEPPANGRTADGTTTSVAPTGPKGTTGRTVGPSSGRTSPGETATAPDPGTAEPPAAHGADARYRYLDEEAPEGDGRAAGDQAADAYRNRQGYRPSNGPYGTSRRFAQRERSPRDTGPAERPAVATLRHVMDREEVYKKANGRYGTLAEMARTSGFGLDVPFGPNSFRRKGYKFDLTLEDDGFHIIAVPGGVGPRSFVGDDSGYIRSGLE